MIAVEDLRHRIAAYRDRLNWTMRMKLAGIMVIVLSAFGLVGAIDMQAEIASERATSNEQRVTHHDLMQRLAAARELERGLRGCPPAGPGMTDVVVMVVRYESDIAPRVEHCMRFAERTYLPRRAR